MHKIVSYSFAVSAPLDLGEPSSFEMVGEPDVLLRPRRVLCNWTEDDSVTVTSFRVGRGGVVGYPLSITYLDRPIVLGDRVVPHRPLLRCSSLAGIRWSRRAMPSGPHPGAISSRTKAWCGSQREGLLLHAGGLDPWRDTGRRRGLEARGVTAMRTPSAT